MGRSWEREGGGDPREGTEQVQGEGGREQVQGREGGEIQGVGGGNHGGAGRERSRGRTEGTGPEGTEEGSEEILGGMG